MARYTGPKARVSRRLGTNIWGTKGENIAMEKRPYPPGEHGRTRRRGNVSEYLLQLQEKQKARFTYGISERQFRSLYAEASRGRRDRREHAPLLRAASRQRRLPRRLGGHPAPGPPARRPRPHRGQRPAGQHPELPGPQGRRRQPFRDKPATIVVQWNKDVLDRSPPAWLESGDGGFQVTVRELPSASRSTSRCASS